MGASQKKRLRFVRNPSLYYSKSYKKYPHVQVT
jgi:hypothetical protein